ncbi:hypothetical protein B0T10DRAFT_549366 [Thelonectria olida]|uniref:F-box domain-containing protein n=1 Tax=Thelonectria olida TaxID=1576542 RepID=A0A9P8W2P4_9HYPO|nr:hypothetical protein B0T10DRAFT_549366 [Thelonectria olida]
MTSEAEDEEYQDYPLSNEFEREPPKKLNPNIHWHYQRGQWQNVNANYLLELAKIKDLDPEKDKEPALTKYIRTRKYDELMSMMYFGPRVWGSPVRNMGCLHPEENSKPRLGVDVGPPKSSSGLLEKLPNEIIANIIPFTDIASVDALKSMNRRLFHTVWNHKLIRILNNQAYAVLRGIRATKTGQYVSVQDLLALLYSWKCQKCDAFGCYLYLMTFERLCNVCLEDGKQYLPLRESEAAKEFGLSLDVLRTLPRLQVRQGYYGGWGYELYTWIVDRYAARDAGRQLHGSDKNIKEFVQQTDPAVWKEVSKTVRRRDRLLRGKLAPRRPDAAPEYRPSGARNTRLRYTGIVRAPWLHPERLGETIWGFRCIACADHPVGPFHCDIEYTMETFMDHLREAGPIYRGIHHWEDCCDTGECFSRMKAPERLEGSYERPYWNC